MPRLSERVEELIDRAPSVNSLRAHRLHLAAARVWRARGFQVDADLRREQRHAAALAMAAPVLLERVRAAYGGKLVLMKGLEVAVHYRHPSDRFFRDLDLLADDPDAAQAALIKAGFLEFGEPTSYGDTQHLCPLIWPGMPIVVEIHRYPNGPPYLACPRAEEIIELCVPSATGVDGLLAPAPPAHALLLVAHGWAHDPLGRLQDLIDIVSVLPADTRASAVALARRWGWDGMWRVAVKHADAILGADHSAGSVTAWARHLRDSRERTVLESHIARLAAPASTMALRQKPGGVAWAIKNTGTRRADESWRNKVRRSRLAVGHAFMDRSSHELTLRR